MIYTVLPVGSFHGWGVCGKYITKELSRLDYVTLVSPDFTFNDIYDEFDFRLLKSKMIPEEEKSRINNSTGICFDHPVLQATNNSLKPMMPQLRGSINVGYTFFEDTVLDLSAVENGKRHFDTIAAGSTWCKYILREQNSLMLTEMRQVPVIADNQVTAVWDGPSLDETIEKLEFAYHNRDALKDIARQAGEDLSRMTWKHTAQNFYHILNPRIES